MGTKVLYNRQSVTGPEAMKAQREALVCLGTTKTLPPVHQVRLHAPIPVASSKIARNHLPSKTEKGTWAWNMDRRKSGIRVN